MPPTIAWHPQFTQFESWSVPKVEPPASRVSTAASRVSTAGSRGRTGARTSTHDFGAWGMDTVGNRPRAGDSSGSLYFRRKIAPEVVERLPRARSVAAFPGYDPDRDRNYFDKANIALAATLTMQLSQPRAASGSGQKSDALLPSKALGGPSPGAPRSLPRL
mmetsp:Transcript_31032/g.81590  ORF Transcript_31032/g.81590 Transcript_31032/m.81590 type:complete len:162 (-) Transcript_31032:87-572(-)